MDPVRKRKLKEYGFAVLIFTGLLTVSYLVSKLGEEEPEQTTTIALEDQDNRLMAYNMCSQWVENRLKAPSTAEFPSVWDGKEESVTKNGIRYTVNSYVDSQNSFGAQIRTQFICETRQASRDKWQLINLEFNQ